MDYTGFIIFILVFVRIVSFMAVTPLFTIKGIPNIAKVGFAILLSYLTYGFAIYDKALIPNSIFSLFTCAVGECIFGLALGFITYLIFQAIKASGQFMDMQMGYSMYGQFDVTTNSNVTLMGNLTNLIGMTIFILIDGPHVLINTIVQSFDVVPVLGVNLPPEIGTYILHIFLKTMVLSIKLSAPVILALFLTDFTMGLIARAVPQLNILMMSMPIKMVVGLLVFSAALPALVHMYIKIFQDMPMDLNNFLKLFPLVMCFASSDKTEEPTDKRKEDAKKKGQVAKSREFVSAMTLIGIAILAVSFSRDAMNIIEDFLTRSINNIGRAHIAQGDITDICIYSFAQFSKVTMPIFITVMSLGVIANIAQTGFIHTTDTLKPKLSRLNPIEGFKRMFSGRALVELLKACASIAVIGYVSYNFLKGEMPTVIKTSDMGIESIAAVSADIVQSEISKVAIIVLILGVADLIYQKRAYKKDLMMTKQEIKEEYKQMEGDPLIKSKIRQKQREMASRRMMHEVPNASVIITNPTHLAVALKYEQGADSAPKLVAKGADEVAKKIKKIAAENDIPIIENKPVARMIYKEVEINEDIPVEMYQAVAEILAMVYSLKKARG